MALPPWCNQPITVRRAPFVVDRYGNTTAVRDWAAAADHVVAGCSVQPASGTEDLEDRNAVVNRWTLYAPKGSDILATDRVVHQGTVYEVSSEIRRWTGATGDIDSTQATLEKVEG
jgi:hypothetical protein